MTPVPGYERYLAVTEDGRVWSYRRARWYKLYQDPRGYWRFDTTIEGRKKTFLVHRLLMLTFRPIPNADEMTVNHKNLDTSDMRLDNLEWVTHLQNIQHAYAHGHHVALMSGVMRSCEKHGMAKLTNEQVEAIKVARASGEKQKSIAARFGVSVPTVSMICSGRTWKRLDEAA